MMKVTYQVNTPGFRTQIKQVKWELGQAIPDVFPYDVLGVQLDGSELRRVDNGSADSLPTFYNANGDVTEMNLYGDFAKAVFGNIHIWSVGESDDDDDDED